MAGSEHSSSDESSVGSKGTCITSRIEETSTTQETKIEFSEDEEALVIRMFNLVGERWALIAGRIPGRTAEEIEKYWNSRYSTSDGT